MALGLPNGDTSARVVVVVVPTHSFTRAATLGHVLLLNAKSANKSFQISLYAKVDFVVP